MGRVVTCPGYMTQQLLSMRKHLSWLCSLFFFNGRRIGDWYCSLACLAIKQLLVSYRTCSFSFVFTPFLTCKFPDKWPIALRTHLCGAERNCVLFPVVTYSVIYIYIYIYTVFWIVIYKILTSCTSLHLYIIHHQLIWITGSLQFVRLSSKKTEVPRFVSQRLYVLDGCVTCKHIIPLLNEPKTISAAMLAGHCTSSRFVLC